MVKLVLNEKGGSNLADTSENGDGPDLRMSKMVLYMTYEEYLASGCDLLWYSDLKDAKISLRDGIKVTLKISDPVILVHTRGIIVCAHCGYTPSFRVNFESLCYTSIGNSSLKITSDECRSYSDVEKPYSLDILLTTTPGDIELLVAILDHCSRSLPVLCYTDGLEKQG